MNNKLLFSAVSVILVNVACVFFAAWTRSHYWYYAMFAIVATGFVTFFGILMQNLAGEPVNPVTSKSMRLAITGLVTSSYIVLLAYLLFIPANTQLANVAENLVTNFTAVVGTVIAFFFGSSAYVESRNTNRNADE